MLITATSAYGATRSALPCSDGGSIDSQPRPRNCVVSPPGPPAASPCGGGSAMPVPVSASASSSVHSMNESTSSAPSSDSGFAGSV